MTKKEADKIAWAIISNIDKDYAPDRVELLTALARILRENKKIKDAMLDYRSGEEILDYFGIDP